MAYANQSDFLGEGVNATPAQPKKRATDPTGLYYLDTGEPTALYYRRQQQNQGLIGADAYIDPSFRPTQEQQDSGEYKLDSEKGLWYFNMGDRGRVYVGNDPAAQQAALETPHFTVQDIGSSDRRSMAPLAPGTDAIPGRAGTQAEANRANAYYAATGNSNPAASGGAMGTTDLSAAAANAQRTFNGIASDRATQARDMYAQGQAAQGRAAPQTNAVKYGPAQTVGSTNAATVNYGPAQQIAQTQQASAGNFGAQQSINAPTLAAARDAAMGSFGAQQSVRAANVAPAAMATAERAAAQQAQNQAGFLAGTAAGARNIADLDFGQANESRAAMGDALNRIRSFVDQGPGESAAQAQLRMAQEQNLGDALSLARSGRGNAAGNMKMALSENAATNAQTNMQAAQLRAQEADAWRAQQLQGLGLEQQGTTAMRSQDIGAAQAQGQHAVSREQIASNVDVSRAGLEQQLAMSNAELGTRANLQNAQLGTSVNLANAEQTNLGSRLQAQLSTDAAIQQAGLANARNIAMGQAGTQVNLSNAEQSNLMNRTQAQMALDAATNTASLANSRNIAIGQAGTQASISNADIAAQRARAQAELANQLAIAQGNSSTEIGVANANNASAAERARAELANQLAIAQGNSTSDLQRANLEASVQTNANNDRLMSELYGYGVDLSGQQLNAANYGAANAYDYANLGAEIDWRNLDRAADIKTADSDRKQKQESAYISGLAAVLAGLA